MGRPVFRLSRLSVDFGGLLSVYESIKASQHTMEFNMQEMQGWLLKAKRNLALFRKNAPRYFKVEEIGTSGSFELVPCTCTCTCSCSTHLLYVHVPCVHASMPFALPCCPPHTCANHCLIPFHSMCMLLYNIHTHTHTHTHTMCIQNTTGALLLYPPAREGSKGLDVSRGRRRAH